MDGKRPGGLVVLMVYGRQAPAGPRRRGRGQAAGNAGRPGQADPGGIPGQALTVCHIL